MANRPLLDRAYYERPDVHARRREFAMQLALDELRRATELAFDQERPEYWRQKLAELEAQRTADQAIWEEFVNRISGEPLN